MTVNVSVINIGNELLLGQTVNTNLSWLGIELAKLGLPITRAIIIKDEIEEIRSALQIEWLKSDVVLMSGGLGPTDDDITKSVIAEFFHKNLEFREDVWECVQNIFDKRRMSTPEINRCQAMVPREFTALTNQRGTAPGLYYQENRKTFFALPGVPLEFKFLFQEYIKDILSQSYQCKPIIIRTLHTWKISESALAERLANLHIQENTQLAWLPQIGRVDLRIYGPDKAKVQFLADTILTLVQDYLWGVDEDTPAEVLQRLMIETKLTLAVAESCTGGWVEKLLTDNPGASNYLLGGIISYSNEVKSQLLGVGENILDEFGAVSVEVASEMASGIRLRTNSDLGIAITGIAGPEGGSLEKPVGTICFAISDKNHTLSEKILMTGDRNTIRFKAAEYIILLLIKHIRRSA